MKNEIILWSSSLIILFLLGYFKNVTGGDYPVTGTFGIQGKKVSYKLDKVSFEKGAYKNIILSDIKGLTGKIIWKDGNDQKEKDYSEIERGMECEIPKLEPGKKISYKLILKYKDGVIEIPDEEFTRLTFWGYIPPFVNTLYFLILFSVMILSLRSILELSNEKKNLKKYSFMTCTLLIAMTIIIFPLRTSYKLGAINNFVPPITDLVSLSLLAILLLWTISTIFIFNKKYSTAITIVASTSTSLLFFLV